MLQAPAQETHPGIIALTAGLHHTCALTNLGEVKCWGSNGNGQLGDGTTIDHSIPADVTGLTSGVSMLAAGWWHTCALTGLGGVKCWGNNQYGQLGDGTTTGQLTPVDVNGLTGDVIMLTAGEHHTCALTDLGGVKCWGSNLSGQLGDGTTTDRLTPVDVSGLTGGVIELTAGESHTCALTSVGGVQCWGRNFFGQVGDGTTTDRLTPTDVSGLTNGITELAAGEYHTCALTNVGGVKCWGNNLGGQLGDGTTTDRLTPVDVSGLTNGVIELAAGGGYPTAVQIGHTCALTSEGGVKCWGYNTYGQLGIGTTIHSSIPMDVSGLTSNAIALAAGETHTCALTNTGGMKCWGNNEQGQLGNGMTTKRLIPGDVAGLTDGIVALASGAWSTHTCALTNRGGAQCWGNNRSGQLGDGTTTDRPMPVDVSGLGNGVRALTTGGSHTCTVTSIGGAKCWGDNENGQLGDGTMIGSPIPVDVNGLSTGVVMIAAGQGIGMGLGGSHTCAVTNAGGAKCWGANWAGQLGDGTWTDRLTPVVVSGLTSDVTAVTAGVLHTCALTSTGGVKCWGDNYYGQLGDGTGGWGIRSATPVDVIGLTSDVTAVRAGAYHTCALTSSGEVKCWGQNYYGQLGDGTTIDRLTPVDVNGLTSGVIALAAGGYHACALTNTGKVKCWGANGSGQLGDGTTTDRLTPMGVNSLTGGVITLAAGTQHTCALTNKGGAKCWGENSDGQLGDGACSAICATPQDSHLFIASASALIAAEGGTLASPLDATTYTFPSDTFTDTVVSLHAIPFSQASTPAGDLADIGHAFEATAAYTTTGQLAQPDQPYTLTIQYTDVELGHVPEDTLALYSWDGAQWMLEPTGQLDLESNTLTTTPDHLGQFAVLGDGQAQQEFDALETYLFYYPASTTLLTAFSPWRDAAWSYDPGGYVDNGYYRATCNTIAVGALVKSENPGSPNADWERIIAMLLSVVAEYYDNPFSPTGPEARDGWGYWDGPDNVASLHWTTGFMGYSCALATALTWPQLSPSERLTVANAWRDLVARLFLARTTDYYAARTVCGNTTTEEAAADAAFLTAMSQFDRDNPDSDAWRIRAQDLFQWAFNNLNPVPGCPAPPNDVNQHYYNYQYTSSNHNMYPHPNYGLSVLHDSARAVMPWAAQGITLTADLSGVNDITALSIGSGSGNHHLYGGFAAYEGVYNSNISFVVDNTGGASPVISDTSDFSFQGRVYNAGDFADYRDFSAQSYLGRSGVSDWGFGADFQNVLFAFTAWAAQSIPNPAANLDLNYTRLLNHQVADAGYDYLPTQPDTGCGPDAEYAAGAWTWGYLAATCGGTQADGDTPRPLVVFFGGAYPLTRSGQINTHLFLNSFGAFNHLVAYLFTQSPYWPPDVNGDSTLPNFAWKPPVYLPVISKP